MALDLRLVPLGIAYAVWSGMALELIGFLGWLVFGQRLNLSPTLGIAMILSVDRVIHLSSSTTGR